MRHFTIWRWDFDTMTILITKHMITATAVDLEKAVSKMNTFVARNSYDKYAYFYTER